MQRIVVLSGAGISAESGIATFRDSNGLWENHRIEDVASPEAWYKNPDLVNSFYNLRRKNVLAATPNVAHLGLVDLESKYDVQIITQNIDDLHERAGSTNVLHLHGEILKMRCEKNEQEIKGIHGDITSETLSSTRHRMRPHIVWFGEAVPAMDAAIEITQSADVFVIIGTSLNVYPAAGLLHYTPSGIPIYIIDKHIPNYGNIPSVNAIEMVASEGVQRLKEILL